MSESNGYGNWAPWANAFLTENRGKFSLVKMVTQRWDGGIDYEVRVDIPGDHSGYEEGEGERCLWACSIAFDRKDDNYSKFVQAAREQQRIADEITDRFTTFGVES